MLQNRTWLLIGRKMANEASPQELQELEDILKANPELHFSLQALTDLWNQKPLQNINELEEAYTAHLARMKTLGSGIPETHQEEFTEDPFHLSENNRPRRWKKLILLSTALSIAAAVLIFINLQPVHSVETDTLKQPTSEISTRNGSKTNIVLPDGTKVWLNAGSKITYDKKFGETTRDVVLAGEAYFDVTHNPQKPFIIHTHAMDIKVLGTEFNVKSYPDEHTTETSLIRGSIEVTLKDKRAEKIILKPNEKLVITDEDTASQVVAKQRNKNDEQSIISLSHLNYFSPDSTIMETSWVNNRIVFQDESFLQLATKLERWYGVQFRFTNKEVEQLRFTGNFENETISEALTAMQITAKFQFKIEEDNSITISN